MARFCFDHNLLGYLLSSEDASTPDSLDLLLSDPAEEPGDGVHDENRLPGHQAQPRFVGLHYKRVTFHFAKKEEKKLFYSHLLKSFSPCASNATLKTLAPPGSLA